MSWWWGSVSWLTVGWWWGSITWLWCSVGWRWCSIGWGWCSVTSWGWWVSSLRWVSSLWWVSSLSSVVVMDFLDDFLDDFLMDNLVVLFLLAVGVVIVASELAEPAENAAAAKTHNYSSDNTTDCSSSSSCWVD